MLIMLHDNIAHVEHRQGYILFFPELSKLANTGKYAVKLGANPVPGIGLIRQTVDGYNKMRRRSGSPQPHKDNVNR